MKVKCQIYTKIVGYCRPVSNWNEGKKQEFKDRKLLSANKNGRVNNF